MKKSASGTSQTKKKFSNPDFEKKTRQINFGTKIEKKNTKNMF